MSVGKAVVKSVFKRVPSPLNDQSGLEEIFNALSSAKAVTSHLDFFVWLQTEVCKYLPHEVLLTSWGNFQTGELNYDAASSLPGIDTGHFYSIPDIGKLMSKIYFLTAVNGSGHMVLEGPGDVLPNRPYNAYSQVLEFVGKGTKSALAYVVPDGRYEEDSLYVFFSREAQLEIDSLTLDLLMPHVDSAIRRIKSLSPDQMMQADRRELAPESLLSDREQQVVYWVGRGKSNQEIGTILGISHNTVKNHLKHIFSKMGVTARSQAVVMCGLGKTRKLTEYK